MAIAPGESWETYWRGGGGPCGAENLPAVDQFWQQAFATLGAAGPPPDMLDIATGDGALVAAAARHGNTQASRIVSVDVSVTALAQVRSSHPDVVAIAADAARLPFVDGAFDLVTSRFGIEYGGDLAMDEAARVVAASGSLMCVIHKHGGALARFYRQSVDAVRRFSESGFLPLATDLFRFGFAAVRGADRRAYDEAGTALSSAVVAVDEILAHYGNAVADGTVARIYSDVARIHSRLQAYEPAEVLDWLDRLREEVTAYETRMRSMVDAAVDERRFEAFCARLQAQRFIIVRGSPLVTAEGADVAWQLIARRS